MIMLTEFQRMLDNKRVAIVGNMTPLEDLLAEIDKHDIVIQKYKPLIFVVKHLVRITEEIKRKEWIETLKK